MLRGTTTVTATTDALINALALGAHLRTDLAEVAEEAGLTGTGVMPMVLVGLTQASRAHLTSTVPKLPSKYGMIPPDGFLFLKTLVIPKTLLNLIKVLRMSVLPKTPLICI